jgi:hypothetical protein
MTVTVVIAVSLHAQEQEKHEFTLGGAYGLSGFKFSLNTPDRSGVISTGYNYFFSDAAGLGTGLELSLYRWSLSAEQLVGAYPAYDGEEPFEFRYVFSGYAETQKAAYLVIPLAFRFQYPLFYDNNLTCFSLGGKVGFPLCAKYRTTGASLSTSAYYPDYDALLESPASRGLGNFAVAEQTSVLRLKTSFTLFAEAGMKFDISNQFSLYASLYADFGLNSVHHKQVQPFTVYNPEKPENFVFNSLLESQCANNGKTPLSLGVCLKLAFKVPD